MAKKKRTRSSHKPAPQKDGATVAPEAIREMAGPLGKAVKSLRELKRLSQVELAGKVPDLLSQPYISRVEKGDIFPRKDRLAALVSALDCTYQKLWATAEEIIAFDNSNEEDPSDFVECLGRDGLGDSYEEVVAVNAALEDEVVIEIDIVNRMLIAGEIKPDDLVRIQKLRDRAETHPADSLREYAGAVGELLLSACGRLATNS